MRPPSSTYPLSEPDLRPAGRLGERWRRFLHCRHAAWLTHGSLLILTVCLFLLLLRLPFWIAFLPCAIVQHRVGVLLHEYIHGIPLPRYKLNLYVLAVWDGLLLMFGLLALFRGTHLAHHRWLNMEGDPGFPARRPAQEKRGFLRTIAELEAIHHLRCFLESLRGKHSYVLPSWVIVGALQSILWIVFWVSIGHAEMPPKLMLLALYNTLIPVSLRGAVEHHSYPGDFSFANEYTVLIPLFNLNRHIHHHEDPRSPWYLLEYRTSRPLHTLHYFTHWFRVYLWRNYVLMQPMPRQRRDDAADSHNSQPQSGWISM